MNESIHIPEWSTAHGCDKFGSWTSFEIKGVVQRLRWIPPGKFLMGSPNDEEGRWKDEDQQHEVTIEQGFWMFDTPCTQALWMAVMSENPSWFCGPTRPVERVSWNDMQDFLDRIKRFTPGLHINLPTEEQWEYACRAGSTAAHYGDLDQIAWYEKNSGYQTCPVAKKQPNAWGLYDMLGNVEEWCENLWIDGHNEKRKIIIHLLRGGWFGSIRDVRAAARIFKQDSSRGCGTGFRCVEVSQDHDVAI